MDAHVSVGEGWGDKELFFHWFLMPFASGSLLSAAKLALTTLNSVAIGLLAWLGVRSAGVRGWLVPVAALAVGPALLVRMDQLRPHNLSLVLLLLVAVAMARRSRIGLVLLCATYALAYTAWHLPVLLGGLLFGTFSLVRQERRRELLWAPLAGAISGLVVHPGFPANVQTWYLQNVAYFLHQDSAVGTEILGIGIAGFVEQSWRGLGLAAIALVLVRPWRRDVEASDFEITIGIFAAITTGMFFTAMRFAEYAVPFAALYVVMVLERLRPWRFTFVGASFAGLIVLGAAVSIQGARSVVTVNHERYGFASADELQRFCAALPAGARVASTWDFTPFYYFAAPQARYLNVLDPIFMAARHPVEQATLERLFAGEATDVPVALADTLASDYLAYHRQVFPALAAQVESDPRFVPVFLSAGHNVVRLAGTKLDPVTGGSCSHERPALQDRPSR